MHQVLWPRAEVVSINHSGIFLGKGCPSVTESSEVPQPSLLTFPTAASALLSFEKWGDFELTWNSFEFAQQNFKQTFTVLRWSKFYFPSYSRQPSFPENYICQRAVSEWSVCLVHDSRTIQTGGLIYCEEISHFVPIRQLLWDTPTGK